MSSKRRICVVITARPSYARIKTALIAIDQHPALELSLVVSGSALLDKYGSVVDVIRADGFVPSRLVHMLVEGESLLTSAKSTGLGIMELSGVFHDLKPDAVLSIADRYETIATAIAASYQNIPVVHIQGGEVTGSIDEKVRHAVTKLADLHLVSNDGSAQRVLRLGEQKGSIHVTGCPSIDLARQVSQEKSVALKDIKLKGVGSEIDTSKPYLVVMQHPVTYEWAEAQRQMRATLEAVNELGVPTLWFWPNVDAGSDASSRAIRTFREEHNVRNMRFIKNLHPEDFLRVLNRAECLVGNSSVGIRECAYLGVPVVNIGSRQDGRERAQNVLDTSHDAPLLRAAITKQMERDRYPSSHIYGDGKAGERIANILAQHTLSVEKRITY